MAVFYGDEHFDRLFSMGQLPTTQGVRGSNFCNIGLVVDERIGRVVVLSLPLIIWRKVLLDSKGLGLCRCFHKKQRLI